MQNAAGPIRACSNWCSMTAIRQEQQRAIFDEQQLACGLAIDAVLSQRSTVSLCSIRLNPPRIATAICLISLKLFSPRSTTTSLCSIYHRPDKGGYPSCFLVKHEHHNIERKAVYFVSNSSEPRCANAECKPNLPLPFTGIVHSLIGCNGAHVIVQQEWQTCVVLPQPVSPQRTTTSLCSRASMTSCSMPVMGSPLRTASMSGRRST